MIDTIIFDADGVILDSEDVWDLAHAEILKRRDRIFDREMTKPVIGGRALNEIADILKKQYDFDANTAELVDETIETVGNLIKERVKFIDGFLDFYNEVSWNYKTCVATALNPRLLEIVDRKLDLSKLFSGNVFTIADVGYRSKPAPDIFLYSAKRMNSNPSTCLVIEDSPNGILAAKSAGMRCVGIATTYPRERISKADIVVNSFSEIKMDGM